MATAHTNTDRQARQAHDRKTLDARPVTPTVVPVILGCLLGVGAVLVGFLAFQH